jgi:enoyl-CoA hydratase/carnithine racemase
MRRRFRSSKRATSRLRASTNNVGDVSVDIQEYIARVEIHRPPHNFFDDKLIGELADAFEALDLDSACRVLVLASEGKSFCAGANFSNDNEIATGRASVLYQQAVRLFACKKPVIAEIQGAAVGGGLGLALVADFRVVSTEAKFAGNFVKLGIHPGFGLTYTLPRLIGVQRANLMFLTGRRVSASVAFDWGLADVFTLPENLREETMKLAAEIAEGAPLAVESTRATLRQGIADAVKAQTDHEFVEQTWLARTKDHEEGIRAVSERRRGNFARE